VQQWTPVPKLLEIFGDALGKKNVSRLPAIHHSLRDVDARAGDIGSFVYIDNSANRGRCAHPCATSSAGAPLRCG
jgi:hypothetical protein